MKLNRIICVISLLIVLLNTSCSRTDMMAKAIERGSSGNGSGSYVTIPIASITIGGDINDWLSVPVMINSVIGNSAVSGTDIEYVKIAVDTSVQKMYVLMKINGGSIDTNYVYALYLFDSGFKKQVYSRYDSIWSVFGHDDINVSSISLTGFDVFISGEYIEFSFDIDSLDLPQYFYIAGDVYYASGGGDLDYSDLDTLATLPVAQKYHVYYNGNGADNGTVPVDATEYYTNQQVTVMGNTGSLFKNNCAFLGWNTQVNGSGDDYVANDTFTIGSSDVFLYAKWDYPLTWDDVTEPKLTNHVQNVSARIDWTPLKNAVKYEIYYVTQWSPLTEVKFDETVNPYYIATQYLSNTYRIKALDISNNILDIRVIHVKLSIIIPLFITGTYTDDFNDGIISPNYFIQNQSQTSESGGYFQLNQNITDNGPYMYLGYDTAGKKYVHFRIKWFQHRTNNYYYGGLKFHLYSNDIGYIGVANQYEDYYSYYGTGVSHNTYDNQVMLPHTVLRDVLDPAERSDEWFTWDIYINTTTGDTEVSIDGVSLGMSNTGIILNNKIVIRIDPVEWFTGSYVIIDDLLIESSDSPY